MNDRMLIKVGIVAAVLFIVMESLDAFMATPLREASSWISYYVLDLFSFPVEKMGTLLKTSRMNFEVAPACSGSTTLRVLIFIGILWTAMQTRINLWGKSILIAIIPPIAIFSNGLRVTALVLMGHSMYKPVEGILHELTGIMTFILASGIVFVMTKCFEPLFSNTKKSSSSALRAALMVVIAGLLYSPFFAWCVKGWTSSPLDSLGYLYVLVSLVGIVILWKRSKLSACNVWLLLFCGVSCFSTLIISAIGSINILSGVSFVFLITFCIVVFHGQQLLFKSLPLLGIGFLGFPTVTYAINKVLSIAFSSDLVIGNIVKFVIALGLLGCYFLLRMWKIQQGKYAFSTRAVDSFVCVMAVFLAVRIFYLNQNQQSADPGRVDISYILGEWVGHKGADFQMNTDSSYKDTWIRTYNKDGLSVHLTITASGGDRHQLHPPEYCLTGGGWELGSPSTAAFSFFPNQMNTVLEMELSKKGMSGYFSYWFTDGKVVIDDYKSMLVEDTLRRLRNEHTKWFLFRVISPSKETFLNEFAPVFHGTIIIDDQAYEF